MNILSDSFTIRAGDIIHCRRFFTGTEKVRQVAEDARMIERQFHLHGLLHEMNVHRPLLFGHSDGAVIALKYASSFPDRTVGVVSEAAHVIIEDVTQKGIRDAHAPSSLRKPYDGPHPS